MDYNALPRRIHSGYYKTGHCQGIAVDLAKGFIYYSFTTCLIKSDLNGNIIGSVDGLLGHLGCIDFNEADGCVYGSLEYKNDAIGKGILKNAGKDEITNAFYCAIFDVDKIDRMHMDACHDGVMRTAYLKEVVDDYLAEENGILHRYGCSGIDGTAIGPMPGAPKDSKQYVFIAYGIYGDINRDDNDNQIILCYEPEKLNASALPLEQGNMHTSGPAPECMLTAFTGNTVYGVQNLEYDIHTGDYYAAVYNGQKPIFANKPMYVIDGSVAPAAHALKVKAVSDFPHGQTGMCALGDGYWYFSQHRHTEEGFSSEVVLYKYENGTFTEA